LSKRKKILINLKSLDGMGDTQIKSIDTFFSNKKNIDVLEKLVKYLKIKDHKTLNEKSLFSGKTIMFTGGFEKMSRSEAKSLAEENGAKILSSITKKLNYLIIGNSKPIKNKIENLHNLKKFDWQKPHQSNLTGSDKAYSPKKNKNAVSKKYKTWKN
ncbi:MAG: NADH-ubiquinone oxidoreductase subunit NDUFA12 family protein, partial [SAR324 cluster bacterium]|nr:NADH-ubiquinone oxidoreductase subunit NDUFA12 family protein [SAR324 cluster bacterium]